GASAPLLIAQFAGAGRTALQATDETYRWTSFEGSDVYYQRYWGQMIRWLARGKLSGGAQRAELLVEPRQAKFGQPIRFQATLASEGLVGGDAGVELAIEERRGKRRTLRLPRTSAGDKTFQGTLADLPPGAYRAIVTRPVTESPPSQEFTVTAPPGE